LLLDEKGIVTRAWMMPESRCGRFSLRGEEKRFGVELGIAEVGGRRMAMAIQMRRRRRRKRRSACFSKKVRKGRRERMRTLRVQKNVLLR
jgi:hypothetical protein